MARGNFKNHKNRTFSKKDIIIITVLIVINLVIIMFGKIRDRNYAKELTSLSQTNNNVEIAEKGQATNEEVKKILVKEVKNKEIVFPRNSYIEEALNQSKFKGIILGDSIAQGSGASKPNILGDEIGGTIFSSLNMLTKETLISDNYSVGGSTVENMLAYISDSSSKKSKAYEYPYWILITGRNEMETMTVEEFKALYKTVVAQGEKNNIDVICVTEPPEINISTGELVEGKYSQYQKAIEEVAAEEGATFVDVYNGLLKKKNAGENISKLSSNGILPNNEGYKYIAELITEGIIGNNVEFKKSETKSTTKLISQYEVNDTVAKTKVQNLSTKSTAKEFNTGNGSVMTLGVGENTSFKMPDGQVTGVVITLIATNNGGNVEVKTKDGQLSKTLKSSSGQVKEISYFISLKDIKDLKEILLVPKGDIYLSGVTVVLNN